MPETVVAVKSIKQSYRPTPDLLQMMETFRQMVNDCLKIGLENNVSTLKRLSKLCYPALAKYNIVSYYKLHAISRAAGILANRKQSLKRGYPTKTPYMRKAGLISSYGFKISGGILRVSVLASGSGHPTEYFDIPLNTHVQKILSDPSLTVRSFMLTACNTVSICYSKEIAEIECTSIEGVDRNLGNLTAGNAEKVVQYDLSKAVTIAENTRSIVRSFKRNDVRIRKKIDGKYGKHRKNRINQLLHHVSKSVVQRAKENKAAITFEDIKNIRRLYQRGNGQGPSYRGRLNGWSFFEVRRQIAYKAAWEGVRIIELSVKETRGTSQLCPRCGKRVQEADRRHDVIHRRQLWCPDCKVWQDRDVVAAMNIARNGRSRFERSKGAAGEAMKGNPTTTAILRVDAAKLSRC